LIKLVFYFSFSFIEPILFNLIKSMQEISSTPTIVECMDDCNDRSFLGKDLSGSQMSSMEYVIRSNPNQTAGSSDNSELPTTQQTRGGEGNQLVVRKHRTFLANVKLEPDLESYEIDSCRSSQGISHHSSENVCLEGGDSLPRCVPKDHENEMLRNHRDFVKNASNICNNTSAETSCQDKNTHGDRLVPPLGVKSELAESDLLGLCENSSTNAAEDIFEKTHTQILNHDGGITFRSHQQKKRKTARYAR
jgi:hypothetical protein